MHLILVVVLLVLALIAFFVWRAWLSMQRAEVIRRFEFPMGLFAKLREHNPQLTVKDCQLVANALRQFFLSYLSGGFKPVSMPSKVADDLWHEFILYTKQYQSFCDKAFGRFLHHTPAVVMSGAAASNDGLRRCFYYSCLQENINPNTPLRLPLLFAIDSKLNIADGFRYAADCKNLKHQSDDAALLATAVIHCGGDFARADGDGSSGFSDIVGGDSSDGGSSDGGGGGCGGGGCSSD